MAQTHSLKKNDTIELEITGYTSEGSGIGRYNGQAVFVSGAAEGDVVETLIIKAKPNYAVGKLMHILKASKDRIRPDCAAFPRCGGCQYRHITYDAELRLKQQKVADALNRIGHLEVEPDPIVGAASPDRYRNKAQYPVSMANGRLAAGFYAPFSHRVIDCKDCRLQPESFAPVLKAVARWAEKYKIPTYDETTGKGLLRHVYLRRGFATGETMVCLVINGEKIFQQDSLLAGLLTADRSITTVLLNHNTEKTNVILGRRCTVLYGDGYIEDELCGKRFRISPLSFYQINHDQAQRLYEQAAVFALTEQTKTLLDLYCGAGTMADRVEKLIGVEIVPEAIEDAKTNAALNGVTNAEFLCADAAQAAKTLRERGVTPDTVILDPPRKGCDETLPEIIAGMEPERIVYVSCDPATLARDCARFAALGYEVKQVVPFDLFPRTVHVETVVSLVRKTPDMYVDFKIDLDEQDLTASESHPTYEEIKAYIQKEYGVKVSSLYISQVKRKLGLEVGESYNKPKSENAKQPQCPADKEKMIVAALKYFMML